jgi:hypothetical protein
MELFIMTPFDTEQRQIGQQDRTALDRYADGATDAGFGQPPQFADDDYLAGYIATIKHLPRDAEGKILHSSPRQHFAFGLVDSPDPCCGEGF